MKKERREAFERLCRDEYPGIVRTAYLITGDREEALDLAQETFVRAYERWRTVSRLDRPGAWLQRVVVNLSLSWRRRQRVRDRPLPPADAAPPPGDPDAQRIAALRTLSPAQRAVVVLRFYADQSVKDVGRALGKPTGTVRSLTSQGLARLRVLLPRTEVEDEARS